MSSDDPTVVYIPPGVAHGFYAVTELDLIYWVTHYFDNTDEHGVQWNDPTAEVPWRVERPILSERDRSANPVEWDDLQEVLTASL
jgi:dTDP-4-dehydrorhamnose 3,5-epimerase